MMRKWLLALAMAAAVGIAAWAAVAGEGKKAPNELRSVAAKIAVARKAVLAKDAKLSAEDAALDERERQLAADRAAFHARLRTASPDLDALERRREAIMAERAAKSKAEDKEE